MSIFEVYLINAYVCITNETMIIFIASHLLDEFTSIQLSFHTNARMLFDFKKVNLQQSGSGILL